MDICHQVPKYKIKTAAFLVNQALPFFPAGTIHLVVVAPGVGSARAPIAVKAGEMLAVGPDNGVLSPFLQGDYQCYRLENPDYILPQISPTFHARDIFAPMAAHLSLGVPISELGPLHQDPLRLAPLQVTGQGQLQGEIIHIDDFGNLITDIPGHWFEEGRSHLLFRELKFLNKQKCYSGVNPGELLLVEGSGGTLEISVSQGSACTRFQPPASTGEKVILHPC